jgi:hypothetical protein
MLPKQKQNKAEYVAILHKLDTTKTHYEENATIILMSI